MFPLPSEDDFPESGRLLVGLNVDPAHGHRGLEYYRSCELVEYVYLFDEVDVKALEPKVVYDVPIYDTEMNPIGNNVVVSVDTLDGEDCIFKDYANTDFNEE